MKEIENLVGDIRGVAGGHTSGKIIDGDFDFGIVNPVAVGKSAEIKSDRNENKANSDGGKYR